MIKKIQIILIALFLCFCNDKESKNTSQDGLILDTAKVYIQQPHLLTRATTLELAKKFEKEIAEVGIDNIDYTPYLRLVFRYQNPIFLPLYYKILEENLDNALIRIYCFNAIKKIGGPKDGHNILEYFEIGNDIEKEIIINSIGYLGDSNFIPILDSMSVSGHLKCTT